MNSIFTPADVHVGRFVPRKMTLRSVSFLCSFISLAKSLSLSLFPSWLPEQSWVAGKMKIVAPKNYAQTSQPNICPNSMYRMYTFMDDNNKTLRFGSSSVMFFSSVGKIIFHNGAFGVRLLRLLAHMCPAYLRQQTNN